jgi:DNA-binding beta-propeller fold protein YncE
MDNLLLVARQGVQHISVYNSTTLELLLSCPVPDKQPVGLAACPLNKLIFVSDLNCIHSFDITTGKSTSWKVGLPARNPRGLSVNSKRNILVTCASLSSYKVQEYTPTGMLVRQVSHGHKLWQAIETINDTLMVSYAGQMLGVAELTWNGSVLRCCGNQPGCADDQRLYPHPLVVDSNGNILVVDFNEKRVQVLDPLLTTARSLQLPADITDKLGARALCYDESRGRLFVGGQRSVLATWHSIT